MIQDRYSSTGMGIPKVRVRERVRERVHVCVRLCMCLCKGEEAVGQRSLNYLQHVEHMP